MRRGALRSRFARAPLLLALGALLAPPAPASELSSALPHTSHRGPPAGASVAPGVDWSRSRQAPLPAQLTVLWQRKLPAAITANVLVDAQGNLFAAGANRVWQLGPDGRDQFARTLDESVAVATALLASGRRVVLGREGTLASWSPQGVLDFLVDLQLPGGWGRASLLPLPDGNLLVSAGAWLLQLSAAGELLAHASVREPVLETLVSAGRVLVLTEGRELLQWNGHAAPQPLSQVSGPARAATYAGTGRLFALTMGSVLYEWSSTGESRRLAALEGAGGGVLSVAHEQLLHVLGDNGVLFQVKTSAEGATVEARSVSSGPGQLVSSSDGSVAWLAANAPLTVQRAEGLQSLAAVSCPHPVSLVPAGNGRLAAACRSGLVWQIGPSAAITAPANETR